MERAASRRVRISLEASLEACRDAESLLTPEPLVEGGGLGWTLGRILTANYKKESISASNKAERVKDPHTFSPVILCVASLTFPILPAPKVLLRV